MTTRQTLSNKDKQWVVKKMQEIKPKNNRYALPEENRTDKYSIKKTEPVSNRPTDKADDLIRAGLDLAGKGVIKQALDEFEKARSLSPDNLDNLLNLGFLNTITGNFKNAFEAYAYASSKYPDEPLVRLAMGNLYWLGGQADKALEQWRRIKGDYRPHAEFNILRRSEQVWKRMLEINPVDSDAHSNLGMVYLFAGDLKKALAEFKAVVNLEDGRKEHEFYQAQIYVLLYLQKNNKNHRKEAEQILARLVKGSEAFPHSERLKNFVSSL